jgi:4-hydroxy-3-methylbut-2-enyl diphosphate reductase
VLEQGMKVFLANPRGFCAGVNMAINCVDQVLKTVGPPVYVYHEIVHNRHVVADFARRGVQFVNELADVPECSVVVYSAHGISPEVRQQARRRRLIEVDATCPLVTRVHMEVARFAREGYRIIFIGHRDHDEALGTVGEAPDSILVVESPEEVCKLQVGEDEKVAYVTQTTLSVSDTAKTIAALKTRFPSIRGPWRGDICYATTNRQAAISEFSAEAELVLVIGSKNSSNSQRLLETARQAGKPAYLIDDESEIDLAWFAGKNTVLVTAGASAPEHLVGALVARLRKDLAATVQTRRLAQEDVCFELPVSIGALRRR